MVASFRDLKQSRDAMFEKLNAAVDKQKGGFSKDVRYWEPTLDKAGCGYAVIRFLTAPGEEILPYVRTFSYGFRGPSNKWYVELSPQTIGLPCPVQEHWSNLYNVDKEAAKRFKRNTSYVSNILVIEDPADPENNGKVFLYRYGAKIFERMEMKMKPQFEHDKPVNPFDMWDGCNLELRIITKDKTVANPKGFRNYDTSAWQSPSPVAASDDEIESIWKQEYSLEDLIAPDKFESYETLRAKLYAVMNIGDTPDMGPSSTPLTGASVDPASARRPGTTPAAQPTAEPEQMPWEGQQEEAQPEPAAAQEEDPEIAEYRRLAGLD